MTREPGNSTDGELRSKWTLARRIVGLTALLLVLLLMIAGYNYRALSQIGDQINEITGSNIPMMSRITQLETYQLKQHIAFEKISKLRTSTTPADIADRNRVMAEFERLNRQFDKGIAETIQGANERARTITEYGIFAKELVILQKKHQDFVDFARYMSAGPARIRSSATSSSAASKAEEARQLEEARRLDEEVAASSDKQAADFDALVATLLAEIEGFTRTLTNAMGRHGSHDDATCRSTRMDTPRRPFRCGVA